MMKAIQVRRFGGPEELKLEEVKEPVAGVGEVLIKVRAVGVNPVETYVRKGIYGPKEFPYVPGSDCAGTIEALGEGVAGFKVGDRVYTSAAKGAYAEKTVVPVARLWELPSKVTFEQGAGLGVPFGTAYRALVIRGGAKAGETILVHGASGGVGLASVQIARMLGLRVIGTASSEDGKRLVKEMGASAVVNHQSPEHWKEVMDLTGGKGVDLIAEMLANVNLAEDLKILAKRGRVVVIGSRGKIEIDARDTMSRDTDIRGMSLMHADDEELRGIHAFIRSGLEGGMLSVTVGKVFALAEASKAHDAVMESGAMGKVVLKVS